jgi:hypothetical protein
MVCGIFAHLCTFRHLTETKRAYFFSEHIFHWRLVIKPKVAFICIGFSTRRQWVTTPRTTTMFILLYIVNICNGYAFMHVQIVHSMLIAMNFEDSWTAHAVLSVLEKTISVFVMHSIHLGFNAISLIKFNRHFWVTYGSYFQNWRVNHGRNQREANIRRSISFLENMRWYKRERVPWKPTCYFPPAE